MRFENFNIGTLGVAAVLLTSCAAMKQNYIEQTCNHDAAYAAGVNAAKNGEDMQGAYAQSSGCPHTPETPEALNAAYVSGFRFGLETTGGSRSGYGCKESFGNKVCGYHCTENAGTVRCASTPDQHCISAGVGNVACGYHCASPPTQVICATHRGDNCVINAFGDAKCGRNCRDDRGSKVTCDEPKHRHH
jgi:hypothetical protein